MKKSTMSQVKPFHSLKALFLMVLISILFIESVSAETRYRVRSSDNLNSIVEQFYQNSGLSKSQLMVGILTRNPKAFRGGNINFLLSGKRLTLPDVADIQQISPESARELLSQHARFFRRGITGNLASPTFVEKVDSLNNSEALLAKQTKKIDGLQQESNALKKRLEELVNAKSDRDKRLLELEESLKDTVQVKNNTSVNSPTEARKLEEANKELQQNLRETKSKLAENANSNIALGRRVENLQDALKDKKASNVASSIVNTTEENAAIETIVEDTSATDSNDNLLSKYIWLIPVLLLASFLLYFFRKKNKETTQAYSFQNQQDAFLEPNEDIDSDFEEDSLETSIKLDVARAYIEAEDIQSALDILTEIMEEGSDEQRVQAHDLLESIS